MQMRFVTFTHTITFFVIPSSPGKKKSIDGSTTGPKAKATYPLMKVNNRINNNNNTSQ